MFNLIYDGTNESQPFILNWETTPLAVFRDRGTATRTLAGVTDETRDHPVHGLSYARQRVEDWTAFTRKIEPEAVTLLDVKLPADDDLVVLGLADAGDVDLEDMPFEDDEDDFEPYAAGDIIETDIGLDIITPTDTWNLLDEEALALTQGLITMIRSRLTRSRSNDDNSTILTRGRSVPEEV